MADRLVVAAGVLAWLVVLVAAAVLCIEAVQMLRGGLDGFQEHVAGRAPQLRLLIVQLLLLAVVRFLLPHRVDRNGMLLTAGALVIMVGALAGIDLVLTGRFGIFHAVAAAPLLLMLPSLVRETRRSND